MNTYSIKNMLLALLICVAAVGGVLYMIDIINHERIVLGEQITQIKTTQTQEAVFIQLRRLAEETIAEREEINAYFLVNQYDGNTIRLLNDIEEVWGPALSVEVEPAAFLPVVAEPHNWFELNYQLRGTPEAVRKMVSLFEVIPYHSQLQSVAIRDQVQGESVAEITIRVAMLELL